MSAENKITIITSVRNCMAETKLYLDSLKKHGSAFLDKIIIIDDGSDRETREFLNSQRTLYELYRNPKSRGFAFSNNFGASKATSGWLLFLNNDLILKKGWSQSYDSLVQGNHKLVNMGCAGNIQLDPMYRKIDHAGVTFTNGIPEHFLKGENSIPTNDHTEFLAVTGACFMIRRDLFLDVGGFDETYKTGFEDVDLCLRLSMLGYKNYVLNKSVVIHKRSSTPERNQYQKHNSHIFYGRWGKIITRFQEWELAKRKLELNKKSSLAEYGYVLNKKEAFLFSDRNILHEYFSTFLRQRNLKFANQVLSILVEKFSHEEETQFKRAQFLSASGKLKQAKATLGQILQTNPEHLDASLLKQKLCLDEGDIKIALKVLREAEKYHPDSPRVFLGICKCMQSVGKWQEAERNARISTLLDSSFNPGWKALSLIFKKQGNTKDEIRILRLLLDREPQDLRVLDQLIAAYASLQLTQEIWGLCHHYESRIVTIASLLHCAQACYGVGDFKRCTFFVEKVLSENSFNTNALMLRGNQAVASKQFSRAIKDYEKVLDFKPDSWEALSNLSNSKSFICDWNGRDLEVKSLLNWNNKEEGKFGVFEVSGLYLDESGEFNNAIAKAEFFNKKIQLLKQKLDFSYVSNKGSLKKLGFLSSDFRNHAVGHQLIGLLENLDAEKYEIFIFATSPSEDSEIRKRFEVFGENFRDISDLPLAAKARSIHHANLDLLIDLGGFSRGHNAELLALRPSPRQAHFLGYASTMGKGLVDYTIADRVVIPTSSSKFYGEKVIRMDGCFFPPGEFEGFAPRVKRKEFGLPSRGFVFCAFHAAYKLDPETWASWMRILRAVPESILWLKFKPAIESIKNLTAEAVRQGVSSNRIIMAKDLPDRAAHLSRMTVADLYLDCPLYNGHASAMDALHAKLPILTLKGKRFCSRVGETFMKNLGLPEMVTKNLDEYEKKAIELGRRPSRLLPLRKKISENADAVLSPVLHAKRFQSAIEQILSKKPKISKELKTAKPKVSVEIPNALSLKDFTLVMIRPIGVTNWACNVNMLADELISYGGQTIVIEAAHSDHKTADFSKFVKRVPQLGQSYADILNLVLSKVSTKYLFYLDDPLRALPAKHFSECLHQAQKNLLESKIGFLGVGSNMEPNTGVLVTTTNESSGAKIGGLFAPAFALNLDALTYTGGFRPYNKSLALSCLDLSLRMEQQGYRSSLVEVDKLICPVHTGNDYLKSVGESILLHFKQLWNRKPVSLKVRSHEIGTKEGTRIPWQVRSGKSVGIFLTLFYEDLETEICRYISQIPFKVTIYLSSQLPLLKFKSMVRENGHELITNYPVNFGMDIGDFIFQLRNLELIEKKHDYFLKIHTKRDEKWRNGMLNNLIPTGNYQKIFDLLDLQHFVSPSKFTFPICNSLANKSIVEHELIKNKLKIGNIFSTPSCNEETFHLESYYHLNNDLKNLTRSLLNRDKHEEFESFLFRHFLNNKLKEKHRLKEPVIFNGNEKYVYPAGTMFWFDNFYLKEFKKNSSSFDEMLEELSGERGALVNDIPTYTHFLENWFGLIASHINEAKLIHLRSITFLLPCLQDETASSGGFRTLLNHINFLQDEGYFINLQFCGGSINANLDTQYKYIKAYEIIHELDEIYFACEQDFVYSDVYVATGWQTFEKSLQYEKYGMDLCFFCQDLEYEFSAVRVHADLKLKDRVLAFYKDPRPIFAISSYLKKKLSGFHNGKVIASKMSVVEGDIFKIKNFDRKRSGVCILFSSSKSHRLPMIAIEVMKKLIKAFPREPIYVFGDVSTKDKLLIPREVVILGSLPLGKLCELYNNCKLGACFSTTNPSRIGFEMSACGCPCVEIDCVYTKYDLNSELFTKCEPSAKKIYAAIKRLLTEPKEYQKKYSKCVSYSSRIKFQEPEEQKFSKMLNDTFYK